MVDPAPGRRARDDALCRDLELERLAGGDGRPVLGGLVIAIDGPVACYLLNACCSAVVIALTLTLRLRSVARDSEPVSWSSILAGFRFVLSTNLILATITLDLLAVFLGERLALLPIYARDILQIGPSGLGWLRAAPSIGSFSMAIRPGHRPPMKQAGKSAALGRGGVWRGDHRVRHFTEPVSLVRDASPHRAMDNVSVVVRQTLVQLLTPDAMRGRVSAVNAIFVASSTSLGEFESGVAAGLFGTVAAVVLGGAGTVLVVLAVAAVWPNVARLGSLHELRQGEQKVQEELERKQEA